MNKNLLCIPVVLAAIAPASAYEVSTTIQKKKILLEEFTGINCGFCPQGHEVAHRLFDAQPENVYVVAVHSGTFARPHSDQPDFRTDRGEEIDAELGAYQSGYPCGSVNRHTFEGSSPILSRNYWIKKGKSIHEEDAPVNLHIESGYDGATGILTVRVEGYYTADVPETENRLNVLWTQSDIKGPQNGAGMGDQYIHKHMLRDYITEGWGDPIQTPRKGEYFERSYVYELPEAIREIGVEAASIEVIAFVSADSKEVYNVVGGKPVYSSFEKALGASIKTPLLNVDNKYGYDHFEVRLTNESTQTIQSASFELSLNGEIQPITLETDLPPFGTETLCLSAQPYTKQNENRYEIKLVGLNGEAYECADVIKGQFYQPTESTPDTRFVLQTDLYADENRFLLKNAQGEIVHEFGPFAKGKVTTHEETLTLAPDENYCLEVIDAWGDGIQEPKGYVKIYRDDQTLIDQNYSIQKHGMRSFFQTTLASGTKQNKETEKTRASYHAESGQIILELGANIGNAEISVYAISGNRILQTSSPSGISRCEVSAESLGKGIYLVNVASEKGNETFKIQIQN